MQGNTPTFLIPRFFLRVVLALIAITAVWWQASAILPQPGAYLAGLIVKKTFPWVSDVVVTPRLLELDTTIKVIIPRSNIQDATGRSAVGFLVGELDPRKYSYSLPLLLALVLAGYSRRRGVYMVAGAFLLIPFHAFSMIMALLKDLAIEGGASATTQMGLVQWQLELIAFGYQLGTLMVPTLVPIAIWLWLDKVTASRLLPSGMQRYFSSDAGKKLYD